MNCAIKREILKLILENSNLKDKTFSLAMPGVKAVLYRDAVWRSIDMTMDL
ncbi:hypothetical protein [Thermofilum sp.]|jgi:hypothetical protein|uniref:hypothetical protein n=1 Tax=Thermofilum sp. TaxID=1961369 RepID=UPI002587C1B6|nr:hypothetical protein [Thermofilum sp.]